MVVGFRGNANESQGPASPLVMKAIEGSGKYVPITWSISKPKQFTKESSEFMGSFESANTRMIWRGYDIRLNSPYPLQASILNKPIFFLDENIVKSGSLSASGKLTIGTTKKKNLSIQDSAERTGAPLNGNNNSSLIKDGKIDMDLILIISAGITGLILILIPERKRKRNLIKETNLGLLRRPRQ